MNEALQVFNYNNAKVRIIKDEKGEPWWVAKDVCDILGLNPKYVTERLSSDEKSMVGRTDLGYNPGRPMLAVSEAGLYSLILRSDKQGSLQFKRWITHEVLPSIRKNGGYTAGQESMSDNELLSRAILVAQKTIENREKTIAQQQEKLTAQQPAVEGFYKFIDGDGNYTMEEAAKLLGTGRTRLFRALKDLKMVDFNNLPYQTYVDRGYFMVKALSCVSRGMTINYTKTLVTPKGINYLSKIIGG